MKKSKTSGLVFCENDELKILGLEKVGFPFILSNVNGTAVTHEEFMAGLKNKRAEATLENSEYEGIYKIKTLGMPEPEPAVEKPAAEDRGAIRDQVNRIMKEVITLVQMVAK